MCNGQIMSIAQNTALFSLLGTTYGGNGTSTFALPNLQSRVPLHFGQGPGLSPYALGEVTGTENVTILTSNMPQHLHPFSISANSSTGGTTHPGSAFPATAGSPIYNAATDSTTMAPGNTGVAGGNVPMSIVNPILALNWCIALEGIFPSRN